MSSIAPPLELGWHKEADRTVVSWRPVIAALFLTAAHLPLLVDQARNLWSRPHYQFFPFALVGAAVLGFQRLRGQGTFHPGTRRVCYAILAVSWGLLAVGGAFNSPWLGAVATMITLAAVICAVGGARLFRLLLPAWLFLWLIVPPPLNLDQQLMTALQTLTARCSSRLLDVFGVFHVLAGHVVEVPGRRLMVEEACSGIHSFFAIIPLVVFFVLWAKRPLLRATLLVLAAVAWMLAANVARVTGITVLTAQWGIDVTTGWPHEVFGLAVFAVTLGLLASTDRLVLFLTAWHPFRAKKVLETTSDEAETAAPPPNAERTRLPNFRQTALAGRTVVAAFGTLTVLQLGFCWAYPAPEAAAGGSWGAELSDHFNTLTADMLPARWGPWQRRGFKANPRTAETGGIFSRTWLYGAPGREAAVSVDYPFDGWHELSKCYLCQGWTLVERLAARADVSSGPAGDGVVEAKFHKPLARCGYLLFSLLDVHGRPLQEPQVFRPRLVIGLESLRMLWRRGGGDVSSPARRSTYQLQLFVTSSMPLTTAEQTQAREWFQHLRGVIGPPHPANGEATP